MLRGFNYQLFFIIQYFTEFMCVLILFFDWVGTYMENQDVTDFITVTKRDDYYLYKVARCNYVDFICLCGKLV